MSKSTKDSHIFCATFYLFRYINFLIFFLNMSKSQSNIFAMTLFNGSSESARDPTFSRELLPFQIYYFRSKYTKILNISFTTSRSRSQCTIFVLTSFDGKCQNLQTNFFDSFDFCYVTDIPTDIEMDVPMGICEILQIYLII